MKMFKILNIIWLTIKKLNKKYCKLILVTSNFNKILKIQIVLKIEEANREYKTFKMIRIRKDLKI
jgi:hypothetical protein